MDLLEQLSEITPLMMTIIAVVIVIVEWRYLARKRKIESHKEGRTNLYSALLTYAPIFLVNTLFTVSIMYLVYDYRIYTFDFEWYTWVLAYIGYDFMSYIVHLLSHKVRFLWCIHSVHHSPKEMKASVSFRGSFAEFILAPHLILWLPLLGFHPLQILIIEGIGQLYGVPLHLSEKLFKKRSNKHINKLFVTPSFHRLHHAKNDIYVDTNYALTFTVWDRIFNTFQKELKDSEIQYGLMKELDSEDLWVSQTDEFKSLLNDIKSASKWTDKVKYALMPPGWTHRGDSLTASMIRKKALEDQGKIVSAH